MRLDEIREKRRELGNKIKDLGDRFIKNGDWENDEHKTEWETVCREHDELTEKLRSNDSVFDRLDAIDNDKKQSRNADNPALCDTRFQRPIGMSRKKFYGRSFDEETVIFRTSDGQKIEGRSGTAPMQRNYDGPALGEVLHASLTGDLQRSEFRGALGGIDSQGGFLLSPTLSGQFLDLARSASVVAKAGAVTVPIDGSELVMVQQTGDATAHWRPETANVAASQPSFGRITLKPRTLAAIVPVSIELLEDSANAQIVIENGLRNGMALKIDQAALLGSGSESEPRGITETDGINTINSVGTPSDYGKYSLAVQKVLEANYPGEISDLAWIGHPRDYGLLDRLIDAEGRQIRPTTLTEPLRKYATTSISATLGGGAESLAIVGDFRQLVLGMRYRQVQIRILDSGAIGSVNAANSLQKLIVAHIRVDVAVIRPSWFTVLNGIEAVES